MTAMPNIASLFNGIDWLPFFLSALFMAASPAANQIISLKNGIQSGAKRAVLGLAGRFLAFMLMIIAVSAGIGTLITSSNLFLGLIQWLGVIYLLWLGFTTLFMKRSEDDLSTEQQKSSNRTSGQLMREEFTAAFLNPEAYLLFMVFLPQFLNQDSNGGTGAKIFIIGCAYLIIEFFFALAYVFIGQSLSNSHISPKFKNNLDRASGVALLVIALLLSLQNFR